MPRPYGRDGARESAAARNTNRPGAAFGAVQEIVEILEADPATDWSKVDIDALRQHLIDMDNVTLHAAGESREPDAAGNAVSWALAPER